MRTKNILVALTSEFGRANAGTGTGENRNPAKFEHVNEVGENGHDL